MSKRITISMRLLLILFFLPGLLLAKIKTPSAVVLTWQDDPATSMTIFWHSEPTKLPSYLHYCPVGEDVWQTRLAYSNTPSDVLTIHTVALTGLQPNTNYYFRIDNHPTLHAFHTLSDDPSDPLHFIIGGDAYHALIPYQMMTEEAAMKSPDFVILGGDIAYTLLEPMFFKRRGWEERRWHTFFSEWSKTMIDRAGRHIPLLIAPGNHDVSGPPTDPVTVKSLFYEFYPLKDPMKTYRVFDLNPYLSLFLLDTGHGEKIEGTQTDWLERQLRARQNIRYKLGVYHKAAYPSYYPYDKSSSKKVRQYWTPLFDAYGLTIAFENDNHSYKRTYPIKNEEINKDGTLYLGDGAWSVSPRKPKNFPKAWYLAHAAALNHFFFVTFSPQGLAVQAFNMVGDMIEEIPIPVTK